MLMSAAEYRESLRSYSPTVFVDGRAVDSVADEPALLPGINAIGVTYDLALDPEHEALMTAKQAPSGRLVNRMLHVNGTTDDLLAKLEAVRVLCQRTGCAQRYLAHDLLNALFQATWQVDADHGTEYHDRLLAYLADAQERDLTIGVAMTDGKGDRSLRPHAQPVPDVYVRVVDRRPDGVVISGVKAIVTGAPYVHDLMVMPCRNMTEPDRDFALCCAVPVDAPGVTIVARPAGRPGERAAIFSGRYGQSTGVVIFEDVFVPHERVFLAGEWSHAGFLVSTYATHHRHSCIGARAGFGDLLIGAGMLMTEANGLDPAEHGHLRDAMVELITIVESFYACGVAASVYGTADPAGNLMPETVFANVGKLLLAQHIYDMQRVAHYVSGGLVVALPGPDEDHNPATQASLATLLAGRPDIPAAHRLAVSRLIEDLTASSEGGWYSVISLHGGGSPEAMKREIFRRYPFPDKVELVERLLDRNLLARPDRPVLAEPASTVRQPGKCCPTGCVTPPVPVEITSGEA